MKNFALEATPTTGKNWKNSPEEVRKSLIYEIIKKDQNYDDFEIYQTSDDGEVVFKVNKLLPSNVRGLLLLELEEKLKEIIDEGLTVWLEPVGDRSKLRNLRGINFKPDKT